MSTVHDTLVTYFQSKNCTLEDALFRVNIIYSCNYRCIERVLKYTNSTLVPDYYTCVSESNYYTFIYPRLIIALLLTAGIVMLGFITVFYYGRARMFKIKKNDAMFKFKKFSYLIAVLLTNILFSYLIYMFGGLSGFFAIIVLFKSKDILSVLSQAMVVCVRKPLVALPTQYAVVSIVPIYNETKAEVVGLLNSIVHESTSQCLICIVNDNGTLNSNDFLTHTFETIQVPYKSWKQVQMTINVSFGTLNDVPCMVLTKNKNMGKRDSLIMSHDIFNVSRELCTMNRCFVNTIQQKITEVYQLSRFDYMFCTDADTLICPQSFKYLIQSILTHNAVACCGLVLVNNPNWQFWNLVQNYQYLYGQYIRRQSETMWKR